MISVIHRHIPAQRLLLETPDPAEIDVHSDPTGGRREVWARERTDGEGQKATRLMT